MIKVTEGAKGRASCGHRVRKGRVYYILEQGQFLYSTCNECVCKTRGKDFKVKEVIRAVNLIAYPVELAQRLGIGGGVVKETAKAELYKNKLR